MVGAIKAQQEFEDYISFKIPNDSLGMSNNIVIIRRLKKHSSDGTPKSSLQAVILSMPDGFECIDLSLYKVYIYTQQITLINNFLFYKSIILIPGKTDSSIIKWIIHGSDGKSWTIINGVASDKYHFFYVINIHWILDVIRV